MTICHHWRFIVALETSRTRENGRREYAPGLRVIVLDTAFLRKVAARHSMSG
jgi:hypothetical protein